MKNTTPDKTILRTRTVVARLTGRCMNGAERDGGRLRHAVVIDAMQNGPCWERAACGAQPGRLSNGWVEIDDGIGVTCARCRQAQHKAAQEADRLRAALQPGGVFGGWSGHGSR
jgi:hypothetical protein